MGYVNLRKNRITTQLTRVQTALDALYATFLDLSGMTVESYAFDSGEGLQKSKRQDIQKIHDQIRKMEATEASLLNALYNMGLVNLRVRRKR